MYEPGEEFGTLPVITPEHVDLNLPSVKIDHTKLEHLSADQKDALLKSVSYTHLTLPTIYSV